MMVETAPLVPAEVDLRGMPFMPLDVVRLLDSDLFALTSGDEFKAAVALWCKSWLQVPAASLPDDERVLAHLSGSGARWRKVRTAALRGFVKCSDGRLYHPVVAEKALDAWARRQSYETFRESQRLKAKSGAAKRWAKPDDAHGHTDGDANGHAQPCASGQCPDDALKGQGQGQGEEKKKQEHKFVGKSFRLTPEDYDDWRRLYHAIPDFDAELARVDIGLAAEGHKSPFVAASNKLNHKHQRLLAERPKAHAGMGPG